jgi:hypothetical protein
MTARDKIENLTHAWYGFALFSSVASLLMNGIGVFSIIGTIVSLFVSFLITFFIGRALVNKSRFVRVVVMTLSGLFGVLGVVGIGSALFQSEWSLTLFLAIGLGAVGVYMQFRSLLVLSSVRAYFAS